MALANMRGISKKAICWKASVTVLIFLLRFFCEWAYALSTTAMKVAVGAFFLRIAVDVRHVQLIWTIIIVNILFGFSYFMCAVLQCVPIPYVWLKYATNPPRRSSATCISDGFQVWGSIAHSALCAVSDWTLALLPIAMLWNTTMNNRTKATVCFLMGLGALASTATLVRISYLHTVTTKTDFLWKTFDVAVWSTVEGVGIAANGLATLRPLFRSLLSSTTTLESQSNNYNLDSHPLSTLSASGKRIHMNLRHSTRLSCDNQSSDGIMDNDNFGVNQSKSCHDSRINVKEIEIESGTGSTEVLSDGGRSWLSSPDFLNETSRWRPDNHRLGQFTTTVVGGPSNSSSGDDDNNESDNEIKPRRSTGRNRESNQDRSARPNMTIGITKVTEFSIEDRKASDSDFVGSPIG